MLKFSSTDLTPIIRFPRLWKSNIDISNRSSYYIETETHLLHLTDSGAVQITKTPNWTPPIHFTPVQSITIAL